MEHDGQLPRADAIELVSAPENRIFNEGFILEVNLLLGVSHLKDVAFVIRFLGPSGSARRTEKGMVAGNSGDESNGDGGGCGMGMIVFWIYSSQYSRQPCRLYFLCCARMSRSSPAPCLLVTQSLRQAPWILSSRRIQRLVMGIEQVLVDIVNDNVESYRSRWGVGDIENICQRL